jgi:hypothetical protein
VTTERERLDKTTADTAAAIAHASAGMSVVEVTALVTLFNQMLQGSTASILAAMAANSAAASERWQKHEADHAADLADATRRITDHFALHEARMKAIDKRIDESGNLLTDHLDKEREEDVRMEARVKPITRSVGWLVDHWKELALLLLGIATLINLILNSLQVVYIDPHVHV